MHFTNVTTGLLNTTDPVLLYIDFNYLNSVPLHIRQIIDATSLTFFLISLFMNVVMFFTVKTLRSSADSSFFIRYGLIGCHRGTSMYIGFRKCNYEFSGKFSSSTVLRDIDISNISVICRRWCYIYSQLLGSLYYIFASAQSVLSVKRTSFSRQQAYNKMFYCIFLLLD